MTYSPLIDESPDKKSRGIHSITWIIHWYTVGFGTHEGWNNKIKQITEETYIGEYIVTPAHSSNRQICDTKWTGKLSHDIAL